MYVQQKEEKVNSSTTGIALPYKKQGAKTTSTNQ